MTTALALAALILSLLSLGLVLRARRTPPVPPTPLPPPPPAQPPAAAEDLTAREGLDRLAARARETEDGIAALSERADRLEAEREVARQAHGELGSQVERLDADWSRKAEELRAAIDLLQTSLAALVEQASEEAGDEAGDAAEPDAEARVRTHLHEAGWEDVVLLPDVPGAWRVEARRGGGIAKGRAQLFPDGRVEARLTPPTRAFP